MHKVKQILRNYSFLYNILSCYLDFKDKYLDNE